MAITVDTEWDVSPNYQYTNSLSETKTKKVPGRVNPATATDDKTIGLVGFLTDLTGVTYIASHYTAKSPNLI